MPNLCLYTLSSTLGKSPAGVTNWGDADNTASCVCLLKCKVQKELSFVAFLHVQLLCVDATSLGGKKSTGKFRLFFPLSHAVAAMPEDRAFCVVSVSLCVIACKPPCMLQLH